MIIIITIITIITILITMMMIIITLIIVIGITVIMITSNSGVDGSDESANDDPQGEHQVQVSERNQVGNYLNKIYVLANAR